MQTALLPVCTVSALPILVGGAVMAKKKWDGVSVCRNCKHTPCKEVRAFKRYEKWWFKKNEYVKGQTFAIPVEFPTFENWRARNVKAAV
jgi:hypothetical protein